MIPTRCEHCGRYCDEQCALSLRAKVSKALESLRGITRDEVRVILALDLIRP